MAWEAWRRWEENAHGVAKIRENSRLEALFRAREMGRLFREKVFQKAFGGFKGSFSKDPLIL